MRNILTFLALYLLCHAQAGAALIFTDRADWEEAMRDPTSVLTETFSVNQGRSSLLTFESGITSRTGPGNRFLSASRHQVTNGLFRATYSRAGARSFVVNRLVWEFPEPIFAFGVDLFRANTSDGNIGFQADFDGNGVERYRVSDFLPTPGTGFFGIIGTSAISSLTAVRNGGDFFAVDFDNLSYTTQAQVSSPSVFLLLAIAVPMILIRARKDKS